MSCFSFLKRAGPSLSRHTVEIDEEVSSIQNTKLYTYQELSAATQGFSQAKKIGEGGFGSVYKGILKDGTVAAIKMLSTESRQGVKEFLTEINTISEVEHENLVKLIGCCVQGKHRILIYGFLENNSLAQTLLGGNRSSLQFSWRARRGICIGVAKGLAFLHEEVKPRIVHRDIKASNILLDQYLKPKISDFGLARLYPDNVTHVSTRVAGTTGYLAPEYALRGQLTRKADVYSFGVLLLEIICGRSNISPSPPSEDKYLLVKVWKRHEEGELVTIVDSSLGGDFDAEEATNFLRIGLLCTQDIPMLRPSMSTVVKMLKSEVDVSGEKISVPGILSEYKVKINLSKMDTGEFSDMLSGESSVKRDTFSSGDETFSYATMTFNSIYDRN